MESEVGEPRRVGGPTRHGALPMRRGALVLPSFGGFGPLELVPRRVGGPTRHDGVLTRRDVLFLPPLGGIRFLGTRATSCWRPNASWRTSNTT